MSVEDYKQKGFMLSPAILQAVIDRAERDVMQAYILPIAPEANVQVEGEAQEAFMQLTFLLCLQRSIFGTRSGAKEKTTAQSQKADRWELLSQESATAQMKLRLLAESVGADNYLQQMTDICGIYMKSQYFYI